MDVELSSMSFKRGRDKDNGRRGPHWGGKGAVVVVAFALQLTQWTAFAQKSHAAKSDVEIERAALVMERQQIRGVVRPAAEATISTGLNARVTRVGFREGETFRTGDVLIEFDCARQQAELSALQAQQREMMISYRGAAELLRRKVGSRQDVGISRARLDRASANLEALAIRLKQCTLTAPYDGSVTKLEIREHETSQAGKPLVSIVSSEEPEIELIVPSSWLSWLKPGRAFEFEVNNTPTKVSGKITRIGTTVDAVSQTFKAFGRFTSSAREIIPGMGGRAVFPGRQR